MAEHQAILKMLNILEKILLVHKKDHIISIPHLNQIVIFFKVFIDKCHHGKEEKFLFPAFEEAGIPNEGGLMGIMSEEHHLGRQYVEEMSKALNLKENEDHNISRFSEASYRYTGLLRSHIEKENQILFPMGEARLSSMDRKKISDQFFQWEKNEIGWDQHESFHCLVENLGSIY
jgi:hemerythrin-like domain-containing protein